jgi:hypothetical protein
MIPVRCAVIGIGMVGTSMRSEAWDWDWPARSR